MSGSPAPDRDALWRHIKTKIQEIDAIVTGGNYVNRSRQPQIIRERLEEVRALLDQLWEADD